MTQETDDLRKYPPCPRVGVGVLVMHHDKFLLVKREQEPARGEWSVPGGLIELGENYQTAAARELYEECGITAEIEAQPLLVFEFIDNDDQHRVQYHFVVLDLLGRYKSGELRVGSDIDKAQWFTLDELEMLECNDQIKTLARRAFHQHPALSTTTG